MYASVPIVLSLFVPVYMRVTARVGARAVTISTLLFFATNVLVFWYIFRYHPFPLLPGIFYVWVNLFGVIAPVQAWSFANSLFDTRQAKRLFGLIGAGASLGAITGGVLARYLVEPVGGTVNLLLVLTALILSAAAIVVFATRRVRPKVALTRGGLLSREPLRDALRQIAASPYLRLIAALVFLVAIVTQWTWFQMSLVAGVHFKGDSDALTSFFGTFNFALGTLSFVLQLLVTGPALRRFGIAVTVLMLPLALGLGSTLILLAPAMWSVLLTNGLDQGLRFSLDKASYELLFLPIPPGQRAPLKNAIDIFVNRMADGCGAVLLGLATKGFATLPGLGLGLKGTAAINLVMILAWIGVAWRIRGEYVRTIHDSIHRHRLDTERAAPTVLERSAAEALRTKLAGPDAGEVRYALGLLEVQHTRSWQPALRALLSHPEADIRRRALALLRMAGDREIGTDAVRLLRDPDLGVRTEALLYLTREMHIDPLSQIQELGDFEDFSIRAGMAAFLASPGPTQNLDAARAIVQAMARAPGDAGARERAEAGRVIALVPDAFIDMLAKLIQDEDDAVAREAIRSARTLVREELADPLINALAKSELTDDASDALARYGDVIVPHIQRHLFDEKTDLEIRRELPSVLVRLGSAAAEQALVGSLLQADVTLRHRVIASLNKLRSLHPEVALDRHTIELLLAAEIAGHYRSYQVLGPLEAQLKEDEPVLHAMRATMEQEVERIFRVMALLLPHAGLHDAYVGLRSSNPLVRANALELLDNVLDPELRQVLVPLLDSQVTTEERIALANRLVGAPLDTTEQAVATLLSSEDAWLRSCAVYAVGALQLHELADELNRMDASTDPMLQESLKAARAKLAGVVEPPAPQQPVPHDMGLGVGTG